MTNLIPENPIGFLCFATHTIPPPNVEAWSKSSQNSFHHNKIGSWMWWFTLPTDSAFGSEQRSQAWRHGKPVQFRIENTISIMFTKHSHFYHSVFIDGYEKENYSYHNQILKRVSEKQLKCLGVPKIFCSVLTANEIVI